MYFLFFFSSLPLFLKCSTKWGIPIYFFPTVKRIFGGKRKYLVYVCLPMKRCTMHDNCRISGLLLRGEESHFHFHFFNCLAPCMN